jgi:hypothetical protein
MAGTGFPHQDRWRDGDWWFFPGAGQGGAGVDEARSQYLLAHPQGMCPPVPVS